MVRVWAKTMLFRPRATASLAMRAVCERADARMPRSGFTTGGFHSSSVFLPRGAPLSVMVSTGAPTSAAASSPGLAMVAEQVTKVGAVP